MTNLKTAAIAASFILLSGANARAETCTVYRNGVLEDVYCAVVEPVLETGLDILESLVSLPVRIFAPHERFDPVPPLPSRRPLK